MRLRLSLFAAVCASFVMLMPVCDAAYSAKIPILVYHHIRSTKPYPKPTWSYKMSVSPNVFGMQMKWLKDHGYTTIDLTTFVAVMHGGATGPDKPVVITFDDNNPTQYSQAFPALKKYGETAVFYIVTNRLDNKSFLSRAQVKEMSDAGMDIESHTLTHASLSRLSVANMDKELTGSKKILEDLTGKPVLHIAYPSTMQNAKVRERARAAGYTTGTIMDPRRAGPKDDLLKLPRIEMLDTSDLRKLLP